MGLESAVLSPTEKGKNHIVSHICERDIKQKAINEQTKQRNKLMDRDNRMVVTVGEEGRGG